MLVSLRVLFVVCYLLVFSFLFFLFRFCLISICDASTPHFGSMFWQEHMVRVVSSVTSFSFLSTVGVGASAVGLVWWQICLMNTQYYAFEETKTLP